MKKKEYSYVLFAVLLVAMSALVYYLHYLLFHDAHHIFIYLVGDVAFVFLEVLLVSLIIHKLLEIREKKAMMKKLNMVIGAFFTEVGTSLIKHLNSFCANSEQLAENLRLKKDWTDKKFEETKQKVKNFTPEMDKTAGDLAGLKEFLTERREFLIRLLENPILLEHETFTDCLWAVFHLQEELSSRNNVTALPASDKDHLAGDMKRSYKRLISQWIEHMEHLKNDYPYLFSHSMRTNPFDPTAKVEVA